MEHVHHILDIECKHIAKINNNRTRNGVYICSHGAWIRKLYSNEIECRRFSMQTHGETFTECKYIQIETIVLMNTIF